MGAVRDRRETVEEATRPREPSDGGRGSGRAFRGLVLVFLLSFLNLVGIVLTLTALGGLGEWSRAQFIGMFGVIELASGLANVISPNLWRLPIAELETSKRTDVQLAASAVLLPHWGGLARAAAGLVCVGIAAWSEGLGPASPALVPFVLALAWVIVAISAALARAGVARPDLDVIQFVIRWRRREREATPISIGASVFQFLVGILTVPAAKLLSPSVLYQPELGPSSGAVLVVLAAAAALGGVVWWLWAGRITWRAPREQQREAEEHG